jgi:hypothetical protein
VRASPRPFGEQLYPTVAIVEPSILDEESCAKSEVTRDCRQTQAHKTSSALVIERGASLAQRTQRTHAIHQLTLCTVCCAVAVILMGRSRRAASMVGTTEQIFEVIVNVVVCPTGTFAVDEKTFAGTLPSTEMSVGHGVLIFLPARDRGTDE